MKPNLEDMLVFTAVVEARTFTLAAEQLGRTKSAVSQAVTRLENDLGTRLLYRTTRSLSLTESGAHFYARCCDIKNTYTTAVADVKANRLEPVGTLSVTAPHALCEPVILPAVALLVEQYPNIQVRLLADDTAMDLIEAQVDIAVRVGSLDLQSARAAKLGTLHESLYASPAYVTDRGGLPEDLAEIENWNHIANNWQGIPVKYELPDGSRLRATPKIRCNALHHILCLTAMGAGVARLPDIAAARSMATGSLVKLAAVSSSPIHYVHLYSRTPPAKVKMFVKLMKQQLQQRAKP